MNLYHDSISIIISIIITVGPNLSGHKYYEH